MFALGRIQLPKAEYHADPCPAPSLSSHVAHTLISRSPRHAWNDHPRLNPEFVPENKTEFDLGTTAHALMLGDPETKIEIFNYKDWRTKLAQGKRADAYARGAVPVLQHQADRVAAMVHAGQLQLAASEAAGAFSDGQPEQTLIWQDPSGIYCRARPDWFPNDGAIFYDYKTTGGSAHPDAFYGSAWDLGYYHQAAFYLRGIRHVVPSIRNAEFRFVVQEVDPPHALSVCGLLPHGLVEAEKDIQQAIDTWAWCLKNDKWPGYPTHVSYIGPPPWVQRQREARFDREAQMGAKSRAELLEHLIDWQKPLT